MEDNLYCKDLHEPIIYKDKVEGKSDAQWELLDQKVVAMIHECVYKIDFKEIFSLVVKMPSIRVVLVS